MLVRIHPDSPPPRAISQAVRLLEDDGVIIYPTDTVYGLGCAINRPKAIARIRQLKGLKEKEALFSFICESISQVSQFSDISNENFARLREYLPGPYTLILPGRKRLPAYVQGKRRTIGARIPGHEVPLALVRELGVPLVSTSLPLQSVGTEFGTDPELMHEQWGLRVDMVIDSGLGGCVPSTVLDCTGEEVVVLRAGKGEV